ncbi:MAG: VWA domain-containing protein [Terracidiphilus sp.]
MRKLFCATLLLCCAWVAAGAQRFHGMVIQSQPPVPSSPATSTVVSKTINPHSTDPVEGVIQLDVTVTDASGTPVGGLDRASFTLLDNDKPAKILSFHENDLAVQKRDAPTELVLVLDQLNLNTIDANEAEELLDVFLRQNDGHLALPTSIYRLSTKGLSATSQPSTDGNAVADELAKKNGMRPISPTLPIWIFDDGDSSIQLSHFTLGSIAKEAMKKPGRKLVVWIGYGWHLSQTNPGLNFYETTEFSTRLREARITLYRVNAWNDPKVNDPKHPYDYRKFLDGVQTEKDAAPAKASLEVLTTQSGGEVLGIMTTADFVNGRPTPEQMAHIFLDSLGRVIAENNASYSLSFDPPHMQTFNGNSQLGVVHANDQQEVVDDYHRLKIEIDKPGLVAHTRAGYYNEPGNYDQPRRIPAQQLSVAELEQLLEQGLHKSESQLVSELSNAELTERLSNAKLNAWKSRVHDKKAWQALVALADASAFLELPSAEVPALPKPTLPEEREQLTRIVHYLGDMAPKLPNLLAMRTTDRYGEPPMPASASWKTARADRSLRLEASETVAIHYQNGEDFIENGTGKNKKDKQDVRSLETRGTFGGILLMVVSEAIRGKVTWGGWETGPSGPMEVFRYSVPEVQSHYTVTYCCYPEYLGGGLFQRMTGYHGTIGFDPASGTILRVTVQTDLSEKLPMIRSDIAVDYGPVETGGNTYNCPLKSVSISRGRTLRRIPLWGESFQIFGPFETLLTDVTFSNYHRFGSTARILTDVQGEP